jgi:hypothetical protein
MTNFYLDLIYKKEIMREDLQYGKNGNILVDGFDFFNMEEEHHGPDMMEVFSSLELLESFYS